MRKLLLIWLLLTCFAHAQWTWQGTWSSATAYVANNVVFYNGSTYLCLVGNTNVTPPSNTTDWALVAQAGTAGAPGAAATVSIGSTATGPPLTNAAVVNTGSSSAAVLNFTLPQGASSGDNFPMQNVRDFGAMGNGVTDDTAAIEAAQTFCDGAFPLNGCTLYFPTGIYIEDGLNVHQYEHWTGDGRGITTIKLANNTTGDALTIPNSGYNVTIDNLSVDGNSYGGGNGNCLTVGSTPDVGEGTDYPTTKIAQSGENTSKNSTIRSVALAYCNAAGLLVNSNNYGLHVEDLWVNWPNTYGIWDLGENHFYQDIYIQYALKSGILDNGSNNMFVNTHSYWAGDGGGTNEGGIFEQGNRNIYTGVDIEDTYTNGFQNGGSDSTCSACTVDAGGYSAYEAGTVAVTNGSTTVTGLGTSWTSAENGWRLMVNGTSAVAVTVNSNTSITLSTPWTGNTQPQGQLYRLQNASLSSQAAVGFVFTGQRGNCTSCKLVNYRAGTYNNGYVNIYTVPGSNLQTNLDIEAAPNTSTNSYPFNGNLLMSWGGGLRVLDNSINLPAFGGATSGNPCEPSISETISASAFISGSTEFSLWSVGHLPCPDSLAWTPPQTPGTYNGTPAFLIGQLGTATSGANFNSAELCTQGSAWTGSAANFPQWCWQTVEGTGANPTNNLNIFAAGGTGTTSITLGANTQVTGNLNVTGSITTSSCTGCGGGGGGGDSISSPNSTLNVGGTSTATTLDINLAHSNAFVAEQTINANPAFQATDSADTLRTFGSLLHGVSGIDGISGSNSAAISIESGVDIIERYNAYYNGTNDIFMSSGNTAWEVFLTTAGLQYHSSTNTPTPGATITWGASTTLTNLSFSNISGVVTSAQLPTPTTSALGGVEAINPVSHEWINSINTSGVPQLSQPTAGDLSNGITGSGAVVLQNSPTLTGNIDLPGGGIWNSSGEVGIGISTPGAALEINGSVIFTNENSGIGWGHSNGTTYISADSTSPTGSIRLGTNSTNKLTVYNGGDVALGSAADSGFLFQADGASLAGGIQFAGSPSSNSSYVANTADLQATSGITYFDSVGPNTSTQGSFQIRGLASTAATFSTYLALAAGTGNATFSGSVSNSNGVVIPSTAGAFVGTATGSPVYVQQCTTGSFTPSSVVGNVVTATCTVGTSATGHFVGVAQASGNTPGFYVLQGGIVGTTVTVTAVTVAASTFSAITVNATVF